MFEINGRKIGKEFPTYIIAELSCNHNQDKKLNNIFKNYSLLLIIMNNLIEEN